MKPHFYAKDVNEWRGWIASAKRIETRQNRLTEAMHMLRDKQRLGMV